MKQSRRQSMRWQGTKNPLEEESTKKEVDHLHEETEFLSYKIKKLEAVKKMARQSSTDEDDNSGMDDDRPVFLQWSISHELNRQMTCCITEGKASYHNQDTRASSPRSHSWMPVHVTMSRQKWIRQN